MTNIIEAVDIVGVDLKGKVCESSLSRWYIKDMVEQFFRDQVTIIHFFRFSYDRVQRVKK